MMITIKYNRGIKQQMKTKIYDAYLKALNNKAMHEIVMGCFMGLILGMFFIYGASLTINL